MSFWKSIIPDITVESLVDMSKEELYEIDSFINMGRVDSGGRVLDHVLSPYNSTLAVVMINSTIDFTAPQPIGPVRTSFSRRRRALLGLADKNDTFSFEAMDETTAIDHTSIISILLAILCFCQFAS